MKIEYATPKSVGLNADVLTQMLYELEKKQSCTVLSL